MAQELNQTKIDAMEVDHRLPPESEFEESQVESITQLSTAALNGDHRGVNLYDSDILKLVGIKGFETIVLQGIPDNERTQLKSIPSTSKKTDRKRPIDNEEEESPSERWRHTNESSLESSGITCDGKSTESTGFSAVFSELDE